MTITNTWAIVQMDAYPEYEGQTDVVFTVHWTLTAEDEDGRMGYVYGAQSLDVKAGEEFTPFADLTKQQVLGWLFDAMGAEAASNYEAAAAKQIADQLNPPVINPPLPWAE